MKNLVAVLLTSVLALSAQAQDTSLSDKYYAKQMSAAGMLTTAELLTSMQVTNAGGGAVVTNPVSLLPGGLGQLASDVGLFFADAQPYFGTGVRVGAFGLYNQSKWGGLVDAVYPINANMGVGFGVAYLDHNFYDTTINFNLGTTWNIPVIGHVYTWVESGPAINLHDKTPLAQSFAGVTKDITISAWHVYATGGIGNISTRPGQTYIAGFSIKPPGW
jgi:hypothetical protein